ncbi:hypothetical protein Ddc_09992 [Ditylenchus destructor]|nr:hypothetical protein Ddc_09992 [Ditylenchus destructor]
MGSGDDLQNKANISAPGYPHFITGQRKADQPQFKSTAIPNNPLLKRSQALATYGHQQQPLKNSVSGRQRR